MSRHGPAAALTFIVGLSMARAWGQPQMLVVTANDSRVSVAHAADLVPQAGITVEAWFYFDPLGPGGNNNPTIVRKNPGAESYILRTNSGGGGQIQWILRSTTSGLLGWSVPGQTPVSSWHHVAATYDQAFARVYLDGNPVLAVPFTGPLANTGGDLRIAQGNDPSETWKGRIDALRIWSFARSQAEIQSTMPFEITSAPGLVAAWHFNGNYLDSALSHHGTPFGGAALQNANSPVLSSILTGPALAAVGTTAVWQISSIYPNTPYIFDVSLSGSAPGIPLPAPLPPVPLNPPLLLLGPGGAPGHSFATAFAGFTDLTGQAFPALQVPMLSGLPGLTLSSAFILLDAQAPYGIGFVSNGVSTGITNVPPAVTAVTPGTGPVSGGTGAVIAGANFQPGATVRFGNIPATGVVVLDSSTIVCTVPPGVAGAVAVRVFNPDGQNAALSGAYTYVAGFVIASVAPLSAPPGATVTVTGTGFVAGMSLSAGGSPISPAAITPTSIPFAMPPGIPCSTTLTVTHPSGQSVSVPFNPTPIVSAAVGASGPASGGGFLVLLGSQFHAGTTVTIGGVPATVQFLSPTSLSIVVPPGVPGSVPVLVTSPAGCSVTTSYTYL